MNLLRKLVSLAFLLHEIPRGFSNPICKKGKFYEENVSDYFDCSVCTDQTHYQNCKTCCGSVTSTTLTRSTFTTSEAIRGTTAPMKSTSNSELAKPRPAVNSYGVDFFLQGTPLLAISIALIIGIFLTLAVMFGIVKLVNCYRKKSKSNAPLTPPIEETQADANSSPFVELSLAQSNHDTNSD